MSMNINTEAQKEQAQLEREIDEQRAHIGDTISALEAQFSPGQMLDKVLSYGKTNGADFSRNLVNTVKDNPVPSLLTVLGVAWLMYGQNNRSAYDDYGYASSASYGVDPDYDHHPSKAEELRGKATHLKDNVKGSLGEMGHRVGRGSEHIRHGASHIRHSASHIRDSASHAGHEIRARAGRAGDTFQSLLREQPLAVGAIGIAVGALIAASLPATRTEDQYMGEARDRVANKARQTVREGKQKMSAMSESVAGKERQESNPDDATLGRGFTPPYSPGSDNLGNGNLGNGNLGSDNLGRDYPRSDNGGISPKLNS